MLILYVNVIRYIGCKSYVTNRLTSKRNDPEAVPYAVAKLQTIPTNEMLSSLAQN